MTLTKAIIIESVRTQVGFNKKKSTEIIEILIEKIREALESGEDVLISNFGKFCVKEKRERRGRNPITGEDVMITLRRVLTFKCSGTLRQKINGE
ncbi:integration host factor subunit alpha [Thermodesulfobacteriota bacterium]